MSSSPRSPARSSPASSAPARRRWCATPGERRRPAARRPRQRVRRCRLRRLVPEAAASTGCSEDDIVELPNGCICCTVADDFVPALKKLLDRAEPPEHILIETSGLALPKPLVAGLQLAGDPLARHGRRRHRRRRRPGGGRRRVRRRSRRRSPRSAPPTRRVDHDNPLEEVFEDQLLCADLILLNKTDLLDDAEPRPRAAEIGARLPRAVKVVETAHGRRRSGARARPRAPRPKPTSRRGPPTTTTARTTTTTISRASRCRSARPTRPSASRPHRGAPQRRRACCA